jgi:hypothetical protein
MRSLKMTSVLLIAASMTGCAYYKVVDSAKAVSRVTAGKEFRPMVDGWFVPDARWKEINEAISEKLDQ